MRNYFNFLLLLIITSIISSCDSPQKGITTYSSKSNLNLSFTKFYDFGTLNIKEGSLKIKANTLLADTNKTGKIVQAFLMANNANHIVFLPANRNINIKIEDKEVTFNDDDHLNKFTQQFFNKIRNLLSKKNITNDIISEIDLEQIAQIEKLGSIKKKLSNKEYNLLHAIITGKMAHMKFMLAKQLKATDLDSSYYDFVDSLPLDNDEFMQFSDNVNTLFELVRVKYYRKYHKSFESSDTKIEYINMIIKNRELASAFTCLFASNKIPDLSKKEKEKIITRMKTLKLKERYINHVITVAPATSLGKTIGSKAEYFDSLVPYNKDFSIEQLRGKTIYVDNWATWCGACVEGINHFNSIYNKLKNNDNVIFLFVSFDRSESKWRKFIEKKSFTKKNIIHLYNSKGMNSEYATYYGVRGLPSSFVIDKDLTIKNPKPPIFEDKNFTSFINELSNHN